MDIGCHYRPSAAMGRSLGILHGGRPEAPLGVALDSALMVIGLAQIIDRAIADKRTVDGRIDTRDVAHAVLTEMGSLHSAARLSADITVEQLVDDTIAVTALARLITEAFETRQARDGSINSREVAAHVLQEMRSSKR